MIVEEITRRSFLAGAAGLGALAAAAQVSGPTLVKKAFASEGENGATDEKGTVKKSVWCQMCGLSETYCCTLCTVENGKFTHVEGNPLAGNNCGHGGKTLCAKGNSAPQLVYDPSRILYPMKLTGEKGSGEFERITWDEALDTIA